MPEPTDHPPRMTPQQIHAAQAALDREKCRTWGHQDFSVLTGGLTGAGSPHRVVCTRCETTWLVQR